MSRITDLVGIDKSVGLFTLFLSEEEKEKERLREIYTNPVTKEIEQYASGLMGMRPEVQSQIERATAQSNPGMFFGVGPKFQDTQRNMQGVVENDAVGVMRKNIEETFNLSTGELKANKEAAEIAKTATTEGISPTLMFTLMSAFSGMNNKQNTPIPNIPMATRGLMFQDEDLYKRYNRGLM